MNNLIAILFLFLSVNIFSQWVKQNPIVEPQNLEHFDFIDLNTGWVVGDSGTVLKTINGGQSWETVNINTRANLNSIQFVTSSTGYICGDSGKVFKTINGGNSWIAVLSQGYLNYIAVHFADVNSGLIAASGSVVQKTTNGGISWNLQYVNGNGTISDMFFLNAQTGWFTNHPVIYGMNKTTDLGNSWINKESGNSGKIFFITENTGWSCPSYLYPGPIYKTTNSGSNWLVQNTGSQNIFTIYFTDNNTGYGAGYRGIVKTTNGGNSWTMSEQNSDVAIRYIAFENAQTGFGVGAYGIMIKTTNSGGNWYNVSKGINSTLHAVKFFDENTGYVFGGGGTFAKTTNSGLNWVRKNTNTINDIGRFFFIDKMTGWALTSPSPEQRLLLKTIDGGETWQHIQTGTTRMLQNVFFANNNTGWISGDSGLILRSTNGGINWTQQNINTHNDIFGINMLGNRLIASSPDGGLFTSTNNGAIWQAVAEFGITGLAFIEVVNSTTAYISGYDSLIKTTNSGNSWSKIRMAMPPVFKPLNFINADTGFCLSTGNMIYKTINGGYNWSRSEIQSSHGIYNLSFININTGWVAGGEGVIFKTTAGNTIGITPISNEIPKSFLLHQNYPNPFNPATKISFDIPNSASVKLTVFDITGKEVAGLINEQLGAGKYSIDFDASNLPSGVYFYRITAGDYSLSRKMILLK